MLTDRCMVASDWATIALDLISTFSFNVAQSSLNNFWIVARASIQAARGSPMKAFNVSWIPDTLLITIQQLDGNENRNFFCQREQKLFFYFTRNNVWNNG